MGQEDHVVLKSAFDVVLIQEDTRAYLLIALRNLPFLKYKSPSFLNCTHAGSVVVSLVV